MAVIRKQAGESLAKAKKKLDIYAEIEPDMSVSDRLNKEKWPYTARHANERAYSQRMKCYTVRMRYRALSTRQFWGKGRIRFQ